MESSYFAMRPTAKRLVKTVFLVSVAGFVVLNIRLLLRHGNEEEEDDNDSPVSFERVIGNSSSGMHYRKYKDSETHDLNILSQLNILQWQLGNVSRNATGRATLMKMGSRTDIGTSIWEINRQQTILNLDKFDLSASDSTVVIVVQVHNRPEYLHHLISSLKKARDIEKTLLILSHDYFSEELNEIIAAIDFCPVS